MAIYRLIDHSCEVGNTLIIRLLHYSVFDCDKIQSDESIVYPDAVDLSFCDVEGEYKSERYAIC